MAFSTKNKFLELYNYTRILRSDDKSIFFQPIKILKKTFT